VRLVRPVVARVGTARVFLLEVSLSGALIAHQGNIPPEGATGVVMFEWDAIAVALECQVVRNTLQKMARNANEKSVYHAAMEIIRASDSAMKTLRDMITEVVARALDEQKANAHGIPAVAAQTFQTGKGSQFLRLELLNGAWRRTETTRPDQPMNGFTISAEEPPDHVALLCQTYALADHANRKLIKVMAELSISKAEGIPTRRYSP
jgi:histone H3/H4